MQLIVHRRCLYFPVRFRRTCFPRGPIKRSDRQQTSVYVYKKKEEMNCIQLTRMMTLFDRSIQITVYHQWLAFANIEWIVLAKLSSLPMLNSLRMILCDMDISEDDQSRRAIVEIASMVSDFSLLSP